MTTYTYPVKVALPLNTRACVESGWQLGCHKGQPTIKTTWSDPLVVAVALLFGSDMTADEILALDWS
jgi:hypothetical protein